MSDTTMSEMSTENLDPYHNVLLARRALITKLSRPFLRAVLSYFVIIFPDGVEYIMGATGMLGIGPRVHSTISIAAETGAVMSTGLITASIAFNLLVGQAAPLLHELHKSSDRSSADNSARLARVLLVAASTELIATLAGIVFIAVSVGSFAESQIDLIGPAVSLALAGAAALLAIDSTEVVGVGEHRLGLLQSLWREEATRLRRSYHRLKGGDTTEASAEHGILPLKRNMRRKGFFNAALLCVLTSALTVSLEQLLQILVAQSHATPGNFLLLVILLSMIDGLILYLIFDLLTSAITKDWVSVLGDSFLAMLFILMTMMVAFVPSAAYGLGPRIALAFVTIVSVALIGCMAWRAFADDRGPARWLRKTAAEQIALSHNMLVERLSPTQRGARPQSKSRFDWFSDLAGRSATDARGNGTQASEPSSATSTGTQVASQLPTPPD